MSSEFQRVAKHKEGMFKALKRTFLFSNLNSKHTCIWLEELWLLIGKEPSINSL
ncbi:uncharacterized protein DS421_8g245950 [Arachis hypogaea]|nr:uncharacterized protein DS421_8g245950 [Arachis hypogaea]